MGYFANVAKEKFNSGSRDDKREILFAIGSNLTLKNKILRVDLLNHFHTLSEQENWDKKYTVKFKPQKYTDTLSKFTELVLANPIWLPLVDAFRKGKVELGITLQNIQSFFSNLDIIPNFAI